MSICTHGTLTFNNRLGGAAWCMDCGKILEPTRRDYPREMYGSMEVVQRPPDRPASEQTGERVVHIGVLRRTWVMMNKLAGKNHREHEWPIYVERLEREGTKIIS